MTKPRYKMVRLGTLKKGDVFWSYTSGRVEKGGKFYQVPRVPFRARVIYQTIGGVKVKIIEGGLNKFGFGAEFHTGKDRRVFVEEGPSRDEN